MHTSKVENTGKSNSTSQTLLERVKLRDPQAWQRFAAIYGPIVFNWSFAAGLQSNDAADITQEVFRAVFTSVDGFRRSRPTDSFRGWLFTITRNKIRDHFRAHAQRPGATGGSHAQRQLHQMADLLTMDELAEPPVASDLMLRVLNIMQGEFETSTWQAFWKTAVEDHSPAEVARELGLSLAAIYKAKSRVLNHLRRELDGLTG